MTFHEQNGGPGRIACADIIPEQESHAVSLEIHLQKSKNINKWVNLPRYHYVTLSLFYSILESYITYLFLCFHILFDQQTRTFANFFYKTQDKWERFHIKNIFHWKLIAYFSQPSFAKLHANTTIIYLKKWGITNSLPLFVSLRIVLYCQVNC